MDPINSDNSSYIRKVLRRKISEILEGYLCASLNLKLK